MDKEQALFEVLKITKESLPTKIAGSNQIINNIPWVLLPKSGMISQEDYDLIKPAIEEFNLDNPQKLISWIVDLHFAGIESINNGISGIRKDLLKSEISKIFAMKEKLRDTKPEDDTSHWYKSYANEMIDIIKNLEEKIKDYISDIKEIDELPRYKFFLQANFNKSKVSNAVSLSKASFQAYFEALYIYAVILTERHGANSEILHSILSTRRDYIKSLELSLLLAYDKDKSSFWNKKDMLDKIENIEILTDNIDAYLLGEQEEEVDFENDVNYS